MNYVCDTSHYGKQGPWELPEGWVWTTIDTVSESILYGVSESAKTNGEYKLLRITDIQNGHVDWSTVPFTDYDCSKANQYLLSDNDILFARTGATVGKSYLSINTPSNAIYASYLIRVRPNSMLLPQYVKYYFESGYYWEQISIKSVGVGQPNVNGSVLGELTIPIPPFAEQERIVLEATKFLHLIDIVEEGKKSLSEVSSRIKEQMLDLAIHGKLVPQDSTEEPAIELLRRINPAFKPSHNLHYEEYLPEGWCTAPLSSFCSTINGLWKGNKEPLVNVGVIRNANFTKDFGLDYSKIEYIDVELKSFEKRNLEDGDIIVEKSGGSDNFPVGRSILFNGDSRKYSFSNFTMSLRILDKGLILPKYLYYALQYKYRRGDMKQMQTQTTGLHNLLTDKYLSAPIPIPPVGEQERIVLSIESLFQTVDGIRNLVKEGE